MSALFTQLEEISKLPHGWCGIEKSATLASIILATRPRWVIECGVFSGSSLIPMALACKEVGHGKVIGIDPYSPEASAEGQSQINADWWKSVDHEMILGLAMERIETYAVRNTAELVRCKSDDYELSPAILEDGLGAAHIDGNHSFQALRDVNHFATHVVVGGFVVLDDIHWEGGGTEAARKRLIELGFVELFRVVQSTPEVANDWCVMQRIGR